MKTDVYVDSNGVTIHGAVSALDLLIWIWSTYTIRNFIKVNRLLDVLHVRIMLKKLRT